ncbi:SHOCT domain-containing protein [Dactylosporangium sp. NPDC048998]|uniref:SHOCT domain-containing protein n=1 Tax=Dactylosporangium sp. NPDC048998 TaxID=3363976 RepID=UPI0037200BE6
MKLRVIIATMIGLVAAAAVGLGTYGLIGSGDCNSAETCTVPPVVIVGGIFLGLPVAVIAIAAGGGLLVMGSVVTAIGVGALAAAVEGNTFGWVFGGAFLLVGLGLVWLGVIAGRLARRAATLKESGRPGVAVVLSVSDTGTTVNQSPMAKLQLRVEPADGSAPFEIVATQVVSRVGPPRPNDRFAVKYDPANPTQLVLGEPLPAAPEPASMPAAPLGGSVVDQLAKLDELRRSGALTQAEFDAAKARLLNL